jgi:hypothetical protein
MKKVGTREEVWKGEAERTSGGLTRSDLKPNAKGVLVSIARSNRAKELHPLGPSPDTMFQRIAGGSSAEDAALSLGGSYSRASQGGAFVSGVDAPAGGFLVSGSGTTGGSSRAAEGGFLVSGSGTTGGSSRAAEGGFLVSGSGTTGGAPKKRGRPSKSGGAKKKDDDAFITEGIHFNYYDIPRGAKLGTNKGDYWFIFPDDDKFEYVRLVRMDGKVSAIVGNNKELRLLSVVNPPKAGGSILDDIIGLL